MAELPDALLRMKFVNQAKFKRRSSTALHPTIEDSECTGNQIQAKEEG